MATDIFISYSRKDAEQALALAGQLREAGLTVWMDQFGIAAATSWSKEIVDAIESAGAVLVLLSRASTESKNVVRELSLASESNRSIVPIELESVVLPSEFKYPLAGLQRAKFEDFDGILHAIAKLGATGRESERKASAAIAPVEAAPSTSVATTQIRIAVLPFEDQSPGHDHQWFSDGLTDELILTLNKLDALFVLDRKSATAFRDAKLSVQMIAQELRARYVVTGAVRKAGERLRVQASLIDAVSGATIWAEKFDGTMDDVFEIQEQTALDIVEGLKLTLTPQEATYLEEKLTKSPEAYALLLKARELNNVKDDGLGAVAAAERALELDPECLPALSVLSIAYSNLHRLSPNPNADYLERSKNAIDRIRDLDPSSPYYYAPKANYYLNIGEHELALDMAKKNVELQPKRWSAWAVLAFIQHEVGNTREAMYAYERCVEIDPSLPRIYAAIGWYAFKLGDHDRIKAAWKQARPLFERQFASEANPGTSRVAYMHLAEAAGETAVSVKVAEELAREPFVSSERKAQIGGVLLRNGLRERGLQFLREAIAEGFNQFEQVDRLWYLPIEGTPEYQFIIEHIVRP